MCDKNPKQYTVMKLKDSYVEEDIPDNYERRLFRRLFRRLRREFGAGVTLPVASNTTVGNAINNAVNNVVQEIVSETIPTSISPNVETYKLTFSGAANLKNNSGQPYVTTRLINYLNHIILQYEPFMFTLGTSQGFIELKFNLPVVPNHTIDFPTRLNVAGNPNISYSQVLTYVPQCNPCNPCNQCPNNCNGGCSSCNNLYTNYNSNGNYNIVSYNNNNNYSGDNLYTNQYNGTPVGRLRIYISNNPNYRPQLGDQIQASGHCIQWIKATQVPC